MTRWLGSLRLFVAVLLMLPPPPVGAQGYVHRVPTSVAQEQGTASELARIFGGFQQQFEAAPNLQMKLMVLDVYVQLLDLTVSLLGEDFNTGYEGFRPPRLHLAPGLSTTASGTASPAQVAEALRLFQALPVANTPGRFSIEVSLAAIERALLTLTPDQLGAVIRELERQVATVAELIVEHDLPADLSILRATEGNETDHALRIIRGMLARSEAVRVAPLERSAGLSRAATPRPRFLHEFLMAMGERVHRLDQFRQEKLKAWQERHAERRARRQALREEYERLRPQREREAREALQRREEERARRSYNRYAEKVRKRGDYPVDFYTYRSDYERRGPLPVGTVLVMTFFSLFYTAITPVLTGFVGFFAGGFIMMVLASNGVMTWQTANSVHEWIVYLSAAGGLGLGALVSWAHCQDELLMYRDHHRR